MLCCEPASCDAQRRAARANVSTHNLLNQRVEKRLRVVCTLHDIDVEEPLVEDKRPERRVILAAVEKVAVRLRDGATLRLANATGQRAAVGRPARTRSTNPTSGAASDAAPAAATATRLTIRPPGRAASDRT